MPCPACWNDSRRLASWACAGLLLLAQQRVQSLQHSAMWELDDASSDGNANFMTLTFDVSNLTLIQQNAALGVQALYPLSWTVPQPKKCVLLHLATGSAIVCNMQDVCRRTCLL